MNRVLTLIISVLAALFTAVPITAQDTPLPMPTQHRGLVQRAPFEIPSHLIPQTRAPVSLNVTRFDDPAVGACNAADGVSLREALVNCSGPSSQPVVYLPAGTYTLTSSIVTVGATFTLIGQDPLTTFIQGSPANIRYFDIGLSGANTVTFANITLRNSTSGASGNALRITGNGHANLENIQVTGNLNSVRGTVRFDVETGSTLSANINNSVFSGNSASNGGGLAFTNELGSGTGILRISASTFTGNSATAAGGGITIASTSGYTEAVIDNTLVEGNFATASGTGGGINLSSNTANSLTITGSTISSNSAAVGGGLLFNATDGSLTIRGNQFLNNGHAVAGSAGAMHVEAASNVVIDGSLFDGNRAPGNTSGAIEFDTNVGSVSITNSIVSNNTAQDFGGIYAFLVDSFTASGLTVTGNSAVGQVGGMLLAASNFTSLTNTSITLNSAGLVTGGLSTSRATLLNVQIENNTAPLRPDCTFDTLSGTVTSLGGVSITDMSGCGGTFIAHPADLIDNLLVNGGFEFAGATAGQPAGWTLVNAAGDKRTCNKVGKTFTPYSKCVFRFSASPTEAADLIQNVDLTGLIFSPGEILTLYAMGDGSSPQSVAKLTLKAVYADQPANKSALTFSGNQLALTGQSQILTLTSANVTKLNLKIRHTGKAGKFLLDRVFLVRAP